MIFDDPGCHLGGPWGTLLATGAQPFVIYVIFGRIIFQASSLRPFWWTRCKKEAPPGWLDMQSVHACACFMKIDPFGKKSCLRRPWEGICRILAPFLEPLGTLCALLGALAATCCRTVFAMRFLAIFRGRRPPRMAVCGAGAAPLGLR